MSIIMPATMDRRRFLATCGAVALTPEIVGGAGIGQVRFCRASSTGWLAMARLVCGESKLIAEIEPSASTGFTLLGSEGTLVFDRRGWHVLP